MIARSILFYAGCLLIPTPPSPCPDFGMQFLFSLLIGLLAPEVFVRPVNVFADNLGRGARWFFGLIPGIRIIVEKTDSALEKWKEFTAKKRHSDNEIVDRIYKIFGKEDIIQRIIFGYFVSILLGIVLIYLSIFL